MSLARDLVRLHEQLSGLDPFLPLARGGLMTAPEARDALARLGALRLEDPGQALRLCLQALSVQRSDLAPRLVDVELVATLPEDVPGLTRATDLVVREMLNSARKEIIMLGYEVSEEHVPGLLAEAASRGVEIYVIVDRGRGSLTRLLEQWPDGVPRPRIFQDRERPDSPRYASMHAKCLLVDGLDLLVTSANFTFHGLHGNIEIGVRLSGAPAKEGRKIFSYLVESGLMDSLE